MLAVRLDSLEAGVRGGLRGAWFLRACSAVSPLRHPEAQLPALLLAGAGTCLLQLHLHWLSAVAFLHCLWYWLSTFLKLYLFNTD